MEIQLDAYRNGLRLIVIGGESYPHEIVVRSILDRVHRQRGIKHVIVNDVSRVAHWTSLWAKHERVEWTLVACDLLRDGKNARFCRNVAMLKLQPDGLIAFPGGEDTEMMVTQARRARVKIWRPIRRQSTRTT